MKREFVIISTYADELDRYQYGVIAFDNDQVGRCFFNEFPDDYLQHVTFFELDKGGTFFVNGAEIRTPEDIAKLTPYNIVIETDPNKFRETHPEYFI